MPRGTRAPTWISHPGDQDVLGRGGHARWRAGEWGARPIHPDAFAHLDPMVPDVLVVGAGLAGASAALWARSLGIRVALIEQAPTVGGQLNSVHFQPMNFAGATAGEGPAIAEHLHRQLAHAGIEARFGTAAARFGRRADRGPRAPDRRRGAPPPARSRRRRHIRGTRGVLFGDPGSRAVRGHSRGGGGRRRCRVRERAAAGSGGMLGDAGGARRAASARQLSGARGGYGRDRSAREYARDRRPRGRNGAWREPRGPARDDGARGRGGGGQDRRHPELRVVRARARARRRWLSRGR
ncbi:MAG: FAD-dependent oxidoreductase [Candidatus Eisenbacteria bacterium]|uniref:FAD-dependent oxidoreductase n=1 Tax=Eiseniibacteriota bacterium TaxID=2212470 RepID=A0A538TFW2_UNCEI|nr:MAG: FAD-dependent oxidoreductase [Candidatus Eisenbacteria bacterium]